MKVGQVQGSHSNEPVTNRLTYNFDDEPARFRFNLKLLRKGNAKQESN